MIDDLKAMALYVYTVELGSFSAAANMSGLSPSVVSYHISQLEKKYGAALLYRSTRSLSQTHDGEIFFSHAQQMLESAGDAINLLTGTSEEAIGKLKISMPAALIRSDFTSKIASFSKLNPRIDLSMIYTDKRIDLISEGIDMAIRVGDLPDSSLKARALDVIERKLVCSPEYAKTKDIPAHPEDLRDWDWIKMHMMPPYRAFDHPELGACKLSFSPRIEVDSAEAMYQLSLQDIGLSSPPNFMVEEDLRNGRLVEILPDWKVAPMKIYAVWPANAVKDGLTMRFLTFLTSSKNM